MSTIFDIEFRGDVHVDGCDKENLQELLPNAIWKKYKHDRDFILQQTLNGMLMSGVLSTEEYDIFSKDLNKFYNHFRLTQINKTKEK